MKKTKNVVNTGTRQTATQTSGSTGSVSNTVRVSSTNGQRGAAGTPATYDAMVNERIAEARKMASDRADGAFDRAEGHLAAIHQQVRGQVPAEYRDRVDEHFTKASARIGDMRKKFKG